MIVRFECSSRAKWWWRRYDIQRCSSKDLITNPSSMNAQQRPDTCHTLSMLISTDVSTWTRRSLARPAIIWPRWRTHWAYQSLPGISANLSSMKQRSSDSFHESVLESSEQMVWVEVKMLNRIRARCLGREFRNSRGSRNLVPIRLCHDRLDQARI